MESISNSFQSSFLTNPYFVGIAVGASSIALFLFWKKVYLPQPHLKLGPDPQKLNIEYTGGPASTAPEDVKNRIAKAIQRFCCLHKIPLSEHLPPDHFDLGYSEFTTSPETKFWGLLRTIQKKLTLQLDHKTKRYSIHIDTVSKDCVGKIDKFRTAFKLKTPEYFQSEK